MNFNDYIGIESSEREYKVGVIQWSREFNFKESLKLLLSAKWSFNKCIFNTIIIYFDIKRLPKIISFNTPLIRSQRFLLLEVLLLLVATF